MHCLREIVWPGAPPCHPDVKLPKFGLGYGDLQATVTAGIVAHLIDLLEVLACVIVMVGGQFVSALFEERRRRIRALLGRETPTQARLFIC